MVPPDFEITFVAPNQDAVLTPPLLAHPGIPGDFHQLAASPTRDAGVADSLTGATDIDGEPRCMGTAPDIGGDEFATTVCGATSNPAAGGSTPFDLAAAKKKCKRKFPPGPKRKKCIKKAKRKAAAART